MGDCLTDNNILGRLGQVTGDLEEMDSLRAETYGTLKAVEFLTALYSVGDLNHRTMLLYLCDNKRVIQRINTYARHQSWYPNELLKPHMDVQLQVDYTLQKFPIQSHTDMSRGTKTPAQHHFHGEHV